MLAGMCGFVACSSTLLLLTAALHALKGDSIFYHNYWHAIGLEQLSYPQLQTMMYLAVSLMGFLTLFAARTRSFFFTRMVGTPVLIAAVLSFVASTVLAATDFISEVSSASTSSSLPWPVICVTWVHCIMAFLVQDCCKVLLIKLLQRNTAGKERMASRTNLSARSLSARQLSLLEMSVTSNETAGLRSSGSGTSIISKSALMAASFTVDPAAPVFDTASETSPRPVTVHPQHVDGVEGSSHGAFAGGSILWVEHEQA